MCVSVCEGGRGERKAGREERRQGGRKGGRVEGRKRKKEGRGRMHVQHEIMKSVGNRPKAFPVPFLCIYHHAISHTNIRLPELREEFKNMRGEKKRVGTGHKLQKQNGGRNDVL